MVTGRRQRRSGRVRVRRHRARLNVKVCRGGARCRCTGSAASVLNHVRVLGGKSLRGDGHVVPLRNNGHVVRMSGVRMRMRMGYGRYAHRRGLLILWRYVRGMRHRCVTRVRGRVLRRGLGVRCGWRSSMGSTALLSRPRLVSGLRTVGSLITMRLRLRLLLLLLRMR